MKYSQLLTQAEPFTRFGSNFDRNIADSFNRLKNGIESCISAGLPIDRPTNDARAEELALRLKIKMERMAA